MAWWISRAGKTARTWESQLRRISWSVMCYPYSTTQYPAWTVSGYVWIHVIKTTRVVTQYGGDTTSRIDRGRCHGGLRIMRWTAQCLPPVAHQPNVCQLASFANWQVSEFKNHPENQGLNQHLGYVQRMSFGMVSVEIRLDQHQLGTKKTPEAKPAIPTISL